MRTLTTSIQNALAAPQRTPAISVQLYDPGAHYSAYQTLAISEGLSAACVASDGSIIRAYTDRPAGAFSATLSVQRISDPGNPGQWSAWTVLSSANLMRDAGCTLSNNGGTLRLFAQSGASPYTLLVWTSTNNGATWTGPVTIAAINATIRGIGSAGNNDVFYAYDITGGEGLAVSTWNGSAWSVPTAWTLGTLPACVGIDAAWSAANNRYFLAVSDGSQIIGYSFTPAGPTWALVGPIAPLDSASSVGLSRTLPRLQVFDSLFNLVYLEIDSGAYTGLVYSYGRMRQSLDFIHWSDGIISGQTWGFGPTWLQAPTPPSGSAGAAYYVMDNANIWRAPVYSASNPTQYLDVSAQVLEIQRHEARGKEGKLLLRLSNAGGQYTSLPMLGLSTSIALAEGYNDPGTGVPSTIATGIYYVDSITFTRSPEHNELLIIASDRTRQLGITEREIGPTTSHLVEPIDARIHTTKGTRKKPPVTTITPKWKSSTVRYQRSYYNKQLSWLLTELAAIGRIFAVSIPATSQFSQVVPSYIVPAGHTLRQALDELCAIYSVYYFLDQTETLQFRELAAADPSVWTYQPEIETLTIGSLDERANHVIITGRSSTGTLVYGESYDFPNILQTGSERPLYHTDTQLTTSAQAALKAGFMLADEQRAGAHHTVSVPNNPGLQLLDVVTLTDQSTPTGTGKSLNARIIALAATCIPEKAEFEMALTLEQP